MMHRMLYPRRVDLYSPPTANPVLEMPPFHATVFVFETYEPTEIASSQSSSDDDDEQDKKSKRGEDDEDDDPENSERDRTTSKKRRMGSNISLVLSDELTNSVNIIDENFRPPTPVPSVLLQPPVQALSSLEPTSMPPIVAEETSTLMATPNVFVAQLQIIHIPSADLDVEMSESSRPFSINPVIVAPEGQYRGSAQRTQEEEDESYLTSKDIGDEWEHFDSEMKSLTPAEPTDTVDPKLVMASPAASSGMSITSSRNSSPLYKSTQPRIVDNDSSSEGSGYETSDSSPPSSSDSRPSLTSDDSDAYSPLSLEELTPVGRGDSNALTYSICQHDKAGNLIQEPVPYIPEPSLLFPCDNLESEFVFQVMETFQGPCDNSPLQNGSANELINPFGTSFNTLRGLDEYKISKIALKIYDLIMDLDVYLDQWNGTYPRLTISELEIIRLTIFCAHAERARLVDIGEWRRNLIMLGVSDAPAATRIINQDAPNNRKPPLPRVLIFMRPEEMMPSREHIADALRNRDALETFLLRSGAELLTGLVLKTRLATFFTPTMTSFDTFHLESPPTFKASTTDAFTSIPRLGELANALRFACAAEPILPAEVRVLFSNGYVEPVEYYDAQGRQRAFRGDQLDLSYYAEEV
ncbi:hypothetical protein ARMSODRAFT_981153 [Armillaria solidipes]|uniref:Uncharacterized protein n=1 Tax=Armillaria solidipes TaxID=1076256 RepID=A0A2H3B7G0_9AGAR|nr:hypothetical protein ARMSODRAFT_981153 [Armillaria solidipes]